MKTQWLNYRECATEKEAEEFSDSLIGGGIIQEQNGKWIVFGAREFAEKAANGEIK